MLPGFLLLVIYVFTVTNAAKRVLHSPCPRLFQYEKANISDVELLYQSPDNPHWRGLVTIPGRLLIPGDSAFLKIVLSVPRVLPNKYVGKIEVRGDKSKLLEGGLPHMQYEVYFPRSVPVPSLHQITFNDHVLCNGLLPPSPVLTKIFLEHNLFPLRMNLSSRTDDGSDPGGGFSDSETTTCGSFIPSNPLVIKGKATSVGDWPWLVPVFLSTSRGLHFYCSGTLVDDIHVVSAAHCFKDLKSPENLVAYVGKHNIRNWTDGESQPRGVKNLTIHPDFDPESLYSDIAVLELEFPVMRKKSVAPACLWTGPESVDVVVGRQGTVVGWGIDSVNSSGMTAEPKAVTLPIVSQETCLRSKREFLYLTSNRTLCAGAKNGAGPCNGDSGGGLYLPIKGRWYLRGVISLSLLDTTTQKCDLYQYTVFADIAKFQPWLQHVLGVKKPFRKLPVT